MNDNSSRSDARAHPRRKLITFAWYKRIDDAALDVEEGVAHSCDVSHGGLGIVTARPLPVGARLFIEIVADVGRLSLIGRVAFCAPVPDDCYRVGIQMSCVPPTQRSQWRKLNDL